MKELTIVSVNYKDRRLLDWNYTLTSGLNKTGGLHWLVLDNAPVNTDERMDPDDKRFTVVDGVQFIPKNHFGIGSYHHAAALNKALQLIKTKYVAFIDPDCFIVRPNWIKDITEYMLIKELSFFGAPPHPRKSSSYRYFPYVACLFIDLERVKREALDFTPEIDELKAIRKLKTMTLLRWWGIGTKPKEVRQDINPEKSYVFDIAKRLVVTQIIGRWCKMVNTWVGSSGDTGSRIYRRFYKDRKHKHEYVTPIWTPCMTSANFTPKREFQVSFFHWLIPDAFNDIPKKRGYFTTMTFNEFGLYNVENTFDCESYLWQGEPFCFHIRSIGIQNKSDKIMAESIGSFLHR
jgi:hypothetical protein